MTAPLNVGFPLYQGCTLLDFAGATQIFAYSGRFTPVWLASAMAPVQTTEGVQVMPNATFDNHPPLSMIFVPGGGGEGVAAAMRDPTLQGWLQRTAPTVDWVGSVCTGAFVLAAAGLLDDCDCTTYWSARPVLALFPKLRVVPGYPRWLVDEPRKRFTGGGISSSLDLALRLVELIAGVDTAQSTQLANQYAPSPPVHAGDPTEASPDLVISTTQSQAGFTAELHAATLQVIGQS